MITTREHTVVNCDFLRDPEGLAARLLHEGVDAHSCQDLHVDFLRKTLRETDPAYSELCADIRTCLLDAHQPRFVVLRGLPFIPYHEKGIEELLLCLAASIGFPTETDLCHGRRVWPVTPRKDLQPDHHPTISEHNYMAALHTDSAYRPVPEQYVMLYAVRPARDGGGELSVVDGRSLLDDLAESTDGQRCLHVLRKTEFSFRVPDSFTKTLNPSEYEWIFAPVVGDVPLLRYRHDVMVDPGSPRQLSGEQCDALTFFTRALETFSRTSFRLEAGDMLLTNNHEILHGRTGFTDMNRLLLRIRMEKDDSLLQNV